jgi:hypothetical protein
MEQIRDLYNELDAPGGLKLWQEAQRRNLPVKRREVLEFASKQGANQVLRPRQKFEGKVTAFRINGRWAADLIDYNSRPSLDKKGGDPYQYILIVQDIFSRKIFAHALKNKDQETCRDAFTSIVSRAGVPNRLDTDNGNEFKGEFQDYLNDENIHHEVADARSKNARATLDAAIKSLRQKLTRLQLSENRRDWASLLARAVESHNKTIHGSLIGRSPDDVSGDNNLQFDLRAKAAKDAQQNEQVVVRKTDQLRRLGGFRDEILAKTKFDRSFQPNYGDEVHQVRRVTGNVVVDTADKSYPIRRVDPVHFESTVVDTTGMQQGGSARIDRVRLEKLEPFRDRITAFVGDGKTENEVTRYMKSLGMDQLKNAGFNFRNMLQLLGFSTGEGKGSSTAMVRNLAAQQPEPPAAPPAAVPPPRDGPIRRVTGKRAPLTPAEAAPPAVVPPRNGPLRRIAGKRAPLTPAEAAANLRRRLRGKQPGI